MVFFDHLEQTTLVALHDVIVNQPIESARFDFVIPDDVDVVGTPAAAVTAVP
jgi:outer membrane lipoprotein-sorting protein